MPADVGERFKVTDRPYAPPHCRFRAVPEMTIPIPEKAGGYVGPMYSATAHETDPAAFLPARDGTFFFYPKRVPDGDAVPGDWRGLYQGSLAFWIKGDEFRKDQVTAAELAIDGRKIDVDWLINQNDTSSARFGSSTGGNDVRLEPRSRTDTRIVAELAAGKMATIRLYAAEQLLGERSFDVSTLRLVPDALAAANWACS